MKTPELRSIFLPPSLPIAIEQAAEQILATGTAGLDPALRSRMLQLQRALDGVRNANAAQLRLANQLAVEGVGTLGPPSLDVLNDPLLMEELRRKKEREANLLAGMGHALDTSAVKQAGLLFLLELILRERPTRPGEEPNVGRPGADPTIEDPAAEDASGLVWNSHSDFYAQISALLGALKTEWLSKYQDAMEKFIEFYKEFSDIMEELKPGAVGDKGDIVIDFSKVHAKLKELELRYGLDANALASFPSESAAEAFKESLGLPGLTISGPSADGQFHVKMDLSAVKDIRKSMWNETTPGDDTTEGEPWPDGEKMDSAKYNAWVSAKDSNMEQIKHVSKVLGEKLNEMTQKFDNIVKILSSTIDKITDADMSFVNGL